MRFTACHIYKVQDWLKFLARRRAINFYKRKRNRYDIHNERADSLEELKEREYGAKEPGH